MSPPLYVSLGTFAFCVLGCGGCGKPRSCKLRCSAQRSGACARRTDPQNHKSEKRPPRCVGGGRWQCPAAACCRCVRSGCRLCRDPDSRRNANGPDEARNKQFTVTHTGIHGHAERKRQATSSVRCVTRELRLAVSKSRRCC
eukprot:5198931-Prymnesium_polylepis.1